MITRISSVIRSKSSDLIFDHPYNADSVFTYGAKDDCGHANRSTLYGWSSARFGSAARSALSAVRAAGQPAPDGSISAVGADWPLMQANVSLCNSARPTGNIRVYCGSRTQLGATKVASEDPPRTVVNAAMISRVRVA